MSNPDISDWAKNNGYLDDFEKASMDKHGDASSRMRDSFAKAALPAVIVGVIKTGPLFDERRGMEVIAKITYEIADEMMKARGGA
jgi:hypothetical protein